MKKNAAKKLTYVSRACMTVLTTVLIVLFFCIMSPVGKIQGTARVVNYAGLVRGTPGQSASTLSQIRQSCAGKYLRLPAVIASVHM